MTKDAMIPDVGSERTALRESPGVEVPFTRSQAWGQPPARCYVFTVMGDTLQGQLLCDREETYLASAPEQGAPPEVSLGQELEAWDALSDEAWIHLERTLE